MGILQASILGWVAISFSRGSSRSRDWTMKLMSGLTETATLSSHPACDDPDFREATSGAPQLGGQAGDPMQAAQPLHPRWGPPLPPCPRHPHSCMTPPHPQASGGISALPTHRAQKRGDGSGTHSAGDPAAQTSPSPGRGQEARAVCPLQPPGPRIRAW